MRRTLWLLLLVLPFLAVRPGVAGDDAPRLADVLALEKVVEDAIAEAEPSIACVLVSRVEQAAAPDFVPPGRIQPDRKDDMENARTYVPESFGSGVVIDKSGLVLTTYHVVRDATRVFVRLPGGKGSYADIHAADPRSDLAVLRLQKSIANLKALPRGDATKVRKGQFVISIANPFAAGFRDGSPSASWGIISNLRRRPPGPANEEERAKSLHHYGTLLQLDARLNLGCSGGAVIDLKGRLIGLTTSQAAITGGETPGGFALPMDDRLWAIVEKLKAGEEVEYGFLGVRFESAADFARGLTPDEPGIGVLGVIANSPADQPDASGRKSLEVGDRIIKVEGSPIGDVDDLFLAISSRLAGNRLKLVVVRSGEARQVTVRLVKAYQPEPAIASKRPPARGGLRVDYTSTVFLKYNNVLTRAGLPSGVAIREVVPGSPAQASDKLRVDDCIREVNGRPVTTPAEFEEAMAAAGRRVTLKVASHDGQTVDDVTLDLK
jgi:S1-C subfamily serine protease